MSDSDLRRRRDSVAIIRELLRVYRQGVSKTKAVYLTNLNFALMNDYLEFLRTYGYLEPASTTEQSQIMLTIKGEYLLASLGGLVELEDQITCFRNGSSRKGPLGTSALAIQKRVS